MESWAANKDEILTLAICSNEENANLAASLYLPEKIYSMNVPVFVYQPDNAEILKFAHTDANHYSNIYPFGMQCDSFDPLFTHRLKYAKRINYLYCLEDSGHTYESMCSESELDKYWDMKKV